MKRFISFLLCLVGVVSFFEFDASATNSKEVEPYIIDFSLTSVDNVYLNDDNSRASGLIYSYALKVTKSGTILRIEGATNGSVEVVKCGFKNLTVERRKTSSDSWSDYYEYGNIIREATSASLNTTLSVASGYQYRVTCKHYAKKSLLVTQSISNTSNIVAV